MSLNNNLDIPAFDDDDVVSFENGTVRMSRLRQVLDIAMRSKLPDALNDVLLSQKLMHSGDRQFRDSRAWARRDTNWFQEGVNCEVLHQGAPQWMRGRLRLRVAVEFIPEEPFEVQDFDPQDFEAAEFTETERVAEAPSNSHDASFSGAIDGHIPLGNPSNGKGKGYLDLV